MQSTIRLTDTLSEDMLEVSTFSTYFWILKKIPFYSELLKNSEALDDVFCDK